MSEIVDRVIGLVATNKHLCNSTTCAEPQCIAQAADEIERLHAKNAAAESERDALIATLQSIASNTCCDSCNEASLVARAALERKP